MVNHQNIIRNYKKISESNDPEFIEGPKNNKEWFVYIAQARTGRFYVGITTNPQKRLQKHNSGKGSKFAKDQGPFQLVYVSQPFLNKSDVRKREIQIKGWRREKKVKLITGIYK